MCDCQYFEMFFETAIHQIGETPTGEAIVEQYLEPSYGVCHLKQEYNPDCEGCKREQH